LQQLILEKKVVILTYKQANILPLSLSWSRSTKTKNPKNPKQNPKQNKNKNKKNEKT